MRGERPAGLPFQTVNRTRLIVNLNAAKQLGLKIPRRPREPRRRGDRPLAMEITRRVTEHWTELFIEGRLDGYWAEHLDAGLADVVRDGNHKLRLDLTGVTFISSAGIGVLVKFYKRLDAIKGTLVIVRASPAVRTVLDMTRLTALLVDQSPPSDPATLTVGTTMVRNGMVCELFDLQRNARLRLSAIGGEHAIGSPADRAGVSQVLRCPPSTTAIGVGSFGAEPGSVDRSGGVSRGRGRGSVHARRRNGSGRLPGRLRARKRRSFRSPAVWSAPAPSRGTCASSRPSLAASSRSRRWPPCASSWQKRTPPLWSRWSRPRAWSARRSAGRLS
jgi:anti-sigma B factor antagonist